MSLLNVMRPEASGAVESPAPTGSGPRIQHLPGLDGLRGLAVLAVLLFHGEFDWARGGWLGVSVFFTLSGFLITSLLLAEWRDTGTVSLRAFWGRRFRRLLPASIACLLFIAAYGWLVASPEELRNLRGDLLAALGYVANWRFLARDISYADLFSAPSPVQHFWSLAIEEQFYLGYPLVVLGLLKAGGRRVLTGFLLVAAGASVAWGLSLRTDLDRVYYGTDTRMAELLVGGLVALWWTRRRSPNPGEARRFAGACAALLGAAALLGSVALWVVVAEDSRWVTRGVLPLQALLTVALLVAVTREGAFARLLAIRPLVAMGAVSYGLYLYHWPIFLLLDEERVGTDGVALFAVRMVATTAAALVSYAVIEQPVRRRRVLTGTASSGLALTGSIAAVAVAAVAVTWSLPPTLLAHADADLEDQTIQVREVEEDLAPTAGVPSGLMMIGDSGTYDLAPAVGAVFQHAGTKTFIDATFPGFGLTTEGGSDWAESWARIVDEHDPRLVVVMLGGWDEAFVDEKGAAAYDALVDRAIEVLTRRGAKILWLGMLPGPGTQVERMNGRFRAAAARHPDVVAYTEVGSAVAAPDGTFPRALQDGDDRVLARKPDGWHLCPGGAARLARAVASEAAELGWTVPPTSGWEEGPWTATPRYDDPPGGCDPDSDLNDDLKGPGELRTLGDGQ